VSFARTKLGGCALWILFAVIAVCNFRLHAAGVTVITHGFNSNVEGWVTGMAGQIPNYGQFPGTSFTVYKITLTYDGSSYYFQVTRPAGVAPSAADSGEIIVKLDWSQVAGGGTAPYNRSTYEVANVAAWALMLTNAIPELSGHALAESPIHLIGHSRGGSLVTEMSRLLGTNGLWVDHLTTLDPHPLNNDGNFELFMPTDASALPAYGNVLFRDNYWQDQGDGLFVPNGETVNGAYNRYLYSLGGGYSSTHSDVHLWYHCTLDQRDPADDDEVQITSTQLDPWYVTNENHGLNAGFKWSLIGGGDRASFDQPEVVGPAIRDGYNQNWDFGIGFPQTANRTALSTIAGNWPNVMCFNLISPAQAERGTFAQFSLYYQWAQPSASNATLSVYLDDDFNPYNGNSHLIQQETINGTGAAGTTVSYWDSINPLVAALTESNAPLGLHSLYASISGGGRTRYLYAPEMIEVLPAAVVPSPVLNISTDGTNLVLYWTTNASGFSLLSTTDLSLPSAWVTNSELPVVLGANFVVTNAPDGVQRFYRLKK